MSTQPPQQSDIWNGPAGQSWVQHQPLMDRLLQPFADLLIEATPEAYRGQILDIGCGTGSTTLAIAGKLDPQESHITGIDISAPMLAVAQRRNSFTHATFTLADAQTYTFPEAHFNRIISRFGVMFFSDPIAAFRNLHRTAAPGATMTLQAWRSPQENPFMTTAERTAAPYLEQLPPRLPNTPGQFGFASKDYVEEILTTSGWHDIEITPLDLDLILRPEDLETYITHMGPVGQALATLDEPTRNELIPKLRTAFEPYRNGFTAACWQITALS